MKKGVAASGVVMALLWIVPCAACGTTDCETRALEFTTGLVSGSVIVVDDWYSSAVRSSPLFAQFGGHQELAKHVFDIAQRHNGVKSVSVSSSKKLDSGSKKIVTEIQYQDGTVHESEETWVFEDGRCKIGFDGSTPVAR